MGLTQTGSYLADPGTHTRASKQVPTKQYIDRDGAPCCSAALMSVEMGVMTVRASWPRKSMGKA